MEQNVHHHDWWEVALSQVTRGKEKAEMLGQGHTLLCQADLTLNTPDSITFNHLGSHERSKGSLACWSHSEGVQSQAALGFGGKTPPRLAVAI